MDRRFQKPRTGALQVPAWGCGLRVARLWASPRLGKGPPSRQKEGESWQLGPTYQLLPAGRAVPQVHADMLSPRPLPVLFPPPETRIPIFYPPLGHFLPSLQSGFSEKCPLGPSAPC